MSREITPSMIADIEWLHKNLKVMGHGFDKNISNEYVGRALEFAKGAMWQKEKDLKLKMDLINKLNVRISRLTGMLALFQKEIKDEFNA